MPLAGLENMSGTRVYVAAGEPANDTVATVKAMSWQEVVGCVSFGEWGDDAADVAEPVLSDNRNIHTNGRLEGGAVPVAVQHRTTDAGSALIKTNANTNNLMTVRKVYASGDVEWSVGIFRGKRFRGATGDAVRGYTTNFMSNKAVLEVTAAAWATG